MNQRDARQALFDQKFSKENNLNRINLKRYNNRPWYKDRKSGIEDLKSMGIYVHHRATECANLTRSKKEIKDRDKLIREGLYAVVISSQMKQQDEEIEQRDEEIERLKSKLRASKNQSQDFSSSSSEEYEDETVIDDDKCLPFSLGKKKAHQWRGKRQKKIINYVFKCTNVNW